MTIRFNSIKRQVTPRANQSPLKIALGLAVPTIEAWLLCGIDVHVTEAAWITGLKDQRGRMPYTKGALKRQLYGTSHPSLAIETEAVKKAAVRLSQVVSAFTTNGVFVRQFDPGSFYGDYYGPLIVTDDVLIAVSTYGVYIYRLADGSIQQVISGYNTNCFCYQSAVIGLANNTLYVSSGDKNVYAYAAMPTTAVTLTSPVGSGNSNFSFSFTNTPGATFTAWATTNVGLPLPSWTPLGYVSEIASGLFQFTETNTPANARRFYAVSSP